MLLCDFGGQSSGQSYSMPSSVAGSPGGRFDGPASKSTVISAWVSQLRKRRKKKKRKKKVADLFGIHQYPGKQEKNIAYDTKKSQSGNIDWKRRYERHGLSKASSDNRDRSELPEYVGHYTLR